MEKWLADVFKHYHPLLIALVGVPLVLLICDIFDPQRRNRG